MKLTLRSLFSPVLAALAFAATSAFGADAAASLQKSFAQPPDDARIMVRWWWFGPAVTTQQLEREMQLMKAGGIGGFEVQPTYPLAVDGEVPGLINLKFLSAEHLAALKFTAAKARELGLRFDLTLGSGWPYGGPMFSVTEAAGRLRSQSVPVEAGKTSVSTPQLRDGEKLVAAYANLSGTFKELEIRDGAVQIPAEAPAPASVLFCIAGQTGMKVKRAAYGAEGYVIDHYSADVVSKFIKEIAEPALAACGVNVPYAVFCDSLEVAGEDWTPNFLAEFKQRRGYDLRPLLPALSTDIGPKTKDVRHDWGRTLTELYNERFSAAMQQWAQSHQTRFRVQGYGTPPAALFSYANADLPEGEGYGWKGLGMSRWAASASHLLGRPVTSSETWTWLHSPVFRATPLDMKAEADLHFLQGINQLIAHGWPYTAEGIEYPGWRFYAAAVFNEKNPWWIVMPDVTAYLQRTSHLLRQGTPANDVALYLANSDAWASFVPGRVAMNTAIIQSLGNAVISRILDAGYNFDGFDDQLLAARGKVDGGTLAFGDVRYKVAVLAGVERMPAATLRTLEQFARAGGTVVATRRLPALAPGYLATDADTREVAAIAERLFKAPGAPGIFIEDESQLGATLAARLRPDVSFAPAATDVGVVHRHTAAGEVYFVANTGNVARDVQATFRVEGMQAEIWDPMNGRVAPATVAARPAGGTTVSLALAPYGSTVVAFTKRQLPAPKAAAAPATLPAALDLGTGWTVTFGPDGKPIAMDTLKSWTDDPATKNFSGVAVYEKTIAVPADMIQPGLSVAIDFGESKAPAGGRGGQRFQASLDVPVHEVAVVTINGKRAGSAWHPPYVVDVTGLLKAGENKLRIEVANLAVNSMAGKPQPSLTALRAKYGDRFQPQDVNQIAPVTSGLLGPIHLVARPAANP